MDAKIGRFSDEVGTFLSSRDRDLRERLRRLSTRVLEGPGAQDGVNRKMAPYLGQALALKKTVEDKIDKEVPDREDGEPVGCAMVAEEPKRANARSSHRTH